MQFQEAKVWIESSGRIAVMGHINPDADALGTALGLWSVLKKMGKKADAVFVSDPLPQVLVFLPGFEKVKHALHPRTDLIVAVDCGSFDRLGIERPEGVKVISIDHHRSHTAYGDLNLIDPEAGCAAEVAYRLVEKAGWVMERAAATCFYTALVSDTGFFGYEGVDEATFDFAKKLIRKGADPAWCARMLRENQPLSRLRLLPMVLETLTLYLGGRAAGLAITRRMLAESGATVNETDDIVDYARSLATVEVGFLTREEPDGAIKVSLRSKSEADVSRIAQAYGGGGHRRAAGFTVRGMERETLVKEIISRIEKELEA